LDWGHDHVERAEEILQLFQENPNISIRQLCRIVGTSNTTIWRTLHNENMHPYQLPLHTDCGFTASGF
jgi:predicted DNA-binding transcriptional regulator AlpA